MFAVLYTKRVSSMPWSAVIGWNVILLHQRVSACLLFLGCVCPFLTLVFMQFNPKRCL